jgi:hypothetical protein
MGGSGSGRYGGRPTADASLRIDLAWMLRTGRVKDGTRCSGSLSWNRGGEEVGSISYQAIMHQPGEERLELAYSLGSGESREQVNQTVRLCYTVPHYGGKRWWMICPVRRIRVGKLYLPSGGDRFASRQAWRLGYHIQRVGRLDRSSERLYRFQRKLGVEQGLYTLPSRPKGMRHRTWDKLLKRYWDLEEAADSDLAIGLTRILGCSS